MAETKSIVLALRVTPEFKRRIGVAAGAHAMTDAEYIRAALEIMYAHEPANIRRVAEFAIQMDRDTAAFERDVAEADAKIRA